MANPTIEYSDIYRVLGYVLKLLGIADPNFPTSPRPIPGSPWTKKQVLDLILQADIEVRTWIADTLNHPLRNTITFAVSGSLADGAAIPPAQSTHRYVKITKSSVTRIGKLADSRQQLDQWKANPTIYGNYWEYYYIENGHIYLADATATATLSLADISANRTANGNEGSISTPLRYEWAVVANAMKMTFMQGQDATNKQLYTQLAMAYEQEIKEGKLSLTIPEIFQKLKT